jgi:phosphoenolpyruvate carboxylase
VFIFVFFIYVLKPAKRKAGGIETLRAIPWIFAWTQTRLHLPTWLGVDIAISLAFEKGFQVPKKPIDLPRT